jgi:hypothetical protein
VAQEADQWFQSTGLPAEVRYARGRMRVLYCVVGEGMGHATRSRVVLQHTWWMPVTSAVERRVCSSVEH